MRILQSLKNRRHAGKLLLVALAAVAGACSSSAKPTVQSTVPPTIGSTGPGCRNGNPLANVYHPYRLRVVRNCQTVTGTVGALGFERDGDIHIYVSLNPNESNLLNQMNSSQLKGSLIAEIVPADQRGCTPGQPPPPPPDQAFRAADYNFGICTGADLSAPPRGAEVVLTGPYVDDTSHGWMEIHPVWSMTIVPGVHAASTLPSPSSLAEKD